MFRTGASSPATSRWPAVSTTVPSHAILESALLARKSCKREFPAPAERKSCPGPNAAAPSRPTAIDHARDKELAAIAVDTLAIWTPARRAST
mmetsp:Transcript_3406/g.6369  ORF Transcript_3406/g.6369 Transcript_3406/m.6369 type:complete len:92 (-) Transcript_3406:299-574(-)